ncbi:MAG TPA: SseB family protein [Tepidisphaeraceae bacterium]|nr:SseB family protein [Tepidisphaeraceae bacterium]
MFGFGNPNSHIPRGPNNPRLLKALSGSAEDEGARQGFYEALLNSTLVLPVRSAQEKQVSSWSSKHQFLLVEDSRGSPAVIAFTDWQALQRWQPTGASFLALPMIQLLRDSFPSTASGMWLNVADRSARFVTRAEIARISSGVIAPTYSTQIEKDLSPLHDEFRVEIPKPAPAPLVHRIIECLQREHEVAQGFLMQINRTARSSRLAIGLRLTRVIEEQTVDALLRRVARAVNEGRPQRGAVEVIVLDYNRYQKVSSIIVPIFERR